MELLLRRDQTGGMLGGVKFSLTMKARLTDPEKELVKKYKMSDTVLYEKEAMNLGGSTMGIIASRLLQLRINVNDLVHGKTIECKDIIEMLGAQQQITEASRLFHQMLMAAARFEGEEVVTFQ